MGNSKKIMCLIVFLGIGFIYQTATAQTWLQTKRLTWTSNGMSWAADSTIDETNTIHVAWYEYDSVALTDAINYKRSSDGGGTWTATKQLMVMVQCSLGSPVIASDSNNHVYVVWYKRLEEANFEIYYKKSTNAGNTWSSAKRITWTSGGSGSPSIAVGSGNTIHIVWTDDTPGNCEIYYKKSTNGGTSWTTKRLTWNSGLSSKPNIAVDSSGAISVVWQDDETGNTEIYYKRSTNGGTSWTTKRLTWNSGDSWNPAVSVDSGGKIHVVWDDNSPGNGEVYHKKSTNGGSSWTTKRLTWNSGYSGDPDLDFDNSGNLHVVWHNEISGLYEIFYKRSTNGGSSWTSDRLTWNAGNSSASCVVTDSDNHIHVLWSDTTPGNSELYYKKGNQ